MTAQWDPEYCNEVYGCVHSEHTEHDCYWRYVDNCWDQTMQGLFTGTVLSHDQWLTRRNNG